MTLADRNLNGIVNSKRKLQEQELNNGRLAALAIAGIVAQNFIPTNPYSSILTYTLTQFSYNIIANIVVIANFTLK